MARKAKKETVAADAAPPRDAREVFEEQMKLIRPLYEDLEIANHARAAANSAYRTQLKAAKKAGINIDALTKALALQKREPDDVTKEFTDLNRYLAWLGIPVGTQLGLFDETRTVATAAEDFAKRPISTEASIAKAKTEGFDAGHEAKNKAENPYEEGSPEALAWDAEWDRAQEKRARSLGRKAPTHEPAHA